MKPVKATNNNRLAAARPSKEEAEKAVETLLRWAGEDPGREGLRDTPGRVTRAYAEFFAGYHMDPMAILDRTFADITGYDDFVLVKNIDFVAHCEHHMVPFIGTAHVAYWPDKHVVGISKLGRIVDVFAKRLTNQETMTRQVADSISKALEPKGVAVYVEAAHTCMCGRGVHKAAATTVTSAWHGVFKGDAELQRRFFDYAHKPR
jgi:GTP cyclohydrolase I